MEFWRWLDGFVSLRFVFGIFAIWPHVCAEAVFTLGIMVAACFQALGLHAPRASLEVSAALVTGGREWVVSVGLPGLMAEPK